MIDNVVLLITGTLHDRDITELKEKCHPLGRFPAMASISAGQSVSDLYNEVLVDTPLGALPPHSLSSALLLRFFMSV